MFEFLLFLIVFLLMVLCIICHTGLSNLGYLINPIEYGDKKNGRAPILPEAAPVSDTAEARLKSLGNELWGSYDHDEDAHRYDTTCRKCLGRAFAEGEKEPWQKKYDGN